MRFALVEDEDPKREAVLSLLHREFSSHTVETARSVKSAIHLIADSVPDLLLLDMSLPTFDISPGEPGGRPQSFGGIEVLRYLDSLDLFLPTVVVTAYEAFKRPNGQPVASDVLEAELARDYPSCFCGLVQFDPIRGEWGRKFIDTVNHAIRKERK